MKYKRYLLLFLSVVILSPELSSADDTKITGTWIKKYVVGNGYTNSDPRWSIEVSFVEDGSFIWKSVSLQEKWMADESTQVVRHENEFKGHYSLKDNSIILSFSPVPTGKIKDKAVRDLGFDENLKRGILNYKLENGELTLSAPTGVKRSFHFIRKQNKTFNNSIEATGD